MHRNLRPLKRRQSFPALITTPKCHAKFEVAEPIHGRIIVFCCWFITLCCDLDLWPLTSDFEHLQCIAWSSVTRWNSVPNLYAIEQSAAELLRLQCLTLWPWTCLKCCTWLWNNCHQVWPSTICPYLNYSVFWCWYIMSRCNLDLWPLDQRKRAKSSITQPWIIQFRSNFLRSLNAWHPKCVKIQGQEVKGQGHSVT